MEPRQPDLSRDMQEAMKRTEAALKTKWEREKIEARTVYEISIPEQSIKVFGREHAEHVLRTLKGLKVSGTYRVTKK